MPKEFFKLENVASLLAIPTNSKIHVIGVCGVAMAQLAILLANRGYIVSGSDKEFYEPMGGLLRNSPVKTFQGFNSINIPTDVNLVVIGNAISYNNPEVAVVEEKNLPYSIFPKLVDEILISDKHSIVVTGTHGKSTTTALIASMLYKLNLDPSYFIGGVAEDLPQSFYAGAGKHCVLEGDEYDSSFFAKVPKFSFYRPNTCIVNAIEFDHADIYANLDAINNEFNKLINSLDAKSTAVCCIDFPNLASLVTQWKKTAKCKIITFGESPDSDFRITSRKQVGLSQEIFVSSKALGEFSFSLPLPGVFNARNALSAIIAANILGLDLNAAKNALSSFKRVKRRQELRAEKNGVVLIEDFAHHPTAVFETIKAVREGYPDKKLWAVFEPRSNSSRRKVFQDDYIKAFTLADLAILCNVTARASDQGIELLDVNELANQIKANGVSAVCLPDAQAIKAEILSQISSNDVILVMSNGSFGGLIDQLKSELDTLSS
jgi:UDP-N-acetylmuramate: L-alanyl-gamma-D-glutamyl-meso-diaminopimelate ligase